MKKLSATELTRFLFVRVYNGKEVKRFFMLDSFIFSLNATLPVFFVMLVGVLLKKVGLFSESFASAVDKYVFKVALPVLLFKDISEMDIGEDFDLGFVVFCSVATVLMFLMAWIIAKLFIKDKSMVGAFAQGAARGSAAILGIALVQNIYGSSGKAPLMILVAVPLFNIFSVIILTLGASGEHRSFSEYVKKALFGIITNPIILGILVGIPFALFDITLPVVISKTVSSISVTATPMALLSVGASFSLGKAMAKIKPAFAASMIKLFLLPALFLPLAVVLGFRSSELVSILIMLGSPTTVTCYVMAKNMDNDMVLSSNIIVLATLLSSVSITFWVFLLRSMMFI